MEKKEKHTLEFYGTNYLSLAPLIAFVFFCILFFVIYKDFEMEAICMGGFVSLIVGSLLAKKKGDYWNAVVKGMSSEMMNTLALILLVVGIFGKMMTRAGVAEGFVWIGEQMGLKGGAFVAFSFIATCLLSTSTGTSIGTLFTGFPILYPSGILLGANPVMLAGAILSGAIFGDNVAPISDTTIASASSQAYTRKKGCADIGGVVASRMKYALVAGALAVVCFALFGGSGSTSEQAAELLSQYSDPKGLIMLIPVVILLTIAVKTQNIFVASTWGIISGSIIGIISGTLVPGDVISMQDGALSGFCIDGIKNMLGTVGYLYAVAGVIGVLNESGTMEKIIEKLVNSKLNKTVVGSEIIMGIGIMLTSICLGSANGPAIIMFGPIADEIGKSKGLHPYRRANLLDGFASTLPVIIPVTSSFIFIAVSCVESAAAEYDFISVISPVSIAISTLHCIFLFVVFCVAVFTGWGRRYEGPDGRLVKKEAAAIEENYVHES